MHFIDYEKYEIFIKKKYMVKTPLFVEFCPTECFIVGLFLGSVRYIPPAVISTATNQIQVEILKRYTDIVTSRVIIIKDILEKF